MQNQDPPTSTQKYPQFAPQDYAPQQYHSYQQPMAAPNVMASQQYPQAQPSMELRTQQIPSTLPQDYAQQQYYSYQQAMVVPNSEKYTYAKAKMDLENPYSQQNPPALPNVTTIVNKTGFQYLDEQAGLLIKQKLEWIEVAVCCETENRYNVFSYDFGTEKKGQELFKCKEKSNLCARWCLSGDCRPFEMTISTLVRGPQGDSYEPFLHLDRPCKCTCLCFNRPYVRVNLIEGGRTEYLGKIVDPWNWCDMEFKIFDKGDNHKYTIDGSCCQLGVWCRWPCEPCQTIDFDIRTASGENISTVQKRSAGCLKSALTDMDNFALKFPSSITVADKALLMSAVLFMDFRHFEQNPRRDDNGM